MYSLHNEHEKRTATYGILIVQANNVHQIKPNTRMCDCAGSSKDDHDKKPTHKITDPKDEMSLKNRVAKEKALEKEEEEASKK